MAGDADDEHLDGWVCGREGCPVSASPHRPGTPEHGRWATAWTAGRSAAIPRSEYGASDADKIAAGLPARPSIHGPGIFAPNALLDPPPERDDQETYVPHPHVTAAGLFGHSWVNTIRPDPTPVFPVGTGFRTITASFKFSDADIDRLMKTFGPLADALAPPDPYEGMTPMEKALAMKRKPFVCPRHGPAPGGFCRRCR